MDFRQFTALRGAVGVAGAQEGEACRIGMWVLEIIHYYVFANPYS